MVQGIKNPTSIHEDVGSIPGLASGLRIQRCCGCGVGCCSNLTPSPGTSIFCRYGPKKEEKENKRKNKYIFRKGKK